LNANNVETRCCGRSAGLPNADSLLLSIRSDVAARCCNRVKAQGTRRTDQTPANRPGWKLEGPASGPRMWRQHKRGGAAVGGSRRLEAGVRLVEHPAVEADVRALFETRLSRHENGV
jgi:hypothetical protein